MASRTIIVTLAVTCAVAASISVVRGEMSRSTEVVGANESMDEPTPRAADETGVPSFESWKACVKLIHSDVIYTQSDLQAMFDRPGNTDDLLRNLKLAWERGLLLQPAFYEEAAQLKFFNGSEVTWKEPDHFYKVPDTDYVFGNVDSKAVSKLTIHFESRCSITRADMVGFLEIATDSGPPITLKTVRSVFGHETTNEIDRGIDPHGWTYTPSLKGNVIYANRAKEAREGVRIEAGFYFKFGPSQTLSPKDSDQIADEDVVDRIELRDSAHRVLARPQSP